MMDTVYDALQMELDDQKEHGFNETVIDGMKGFIFMKMCIRDRLKEMESPPRR